jgi:hypothetical protein
LDPSSALRAFFLVLSEQEFYQIVHKSE